MPISSSDEGWFTALTDCHSRRSERRNRRVRNRRSPAIPDRRATIDLPAATCLCSEILESRALPSAVSAAVGTELSGLALGVSSEADGSNLRFVSAQLPGRVRPGMTRLEVEVPLSFAIQDVNVELSHDIVGGNLKLTLVSPAGTRVSLVDSSVALSQVTLNDEAATSIDTASPAIDPDTGTPVPVTGEFIPDTPLSVLDGELSAGGWVLEAEYDGSAGGTINDFALQLEPPSTFVSGDVPVSIQNTQTVTSTLVITDDIPIDDLNVSLDITHPFISELRVYLTSPAGTRVELFTELSRAGSNLPGTVLDDEADVSITSGSGTLSGRFRPEGQLSEFDGEFTFGLWTLEITDTFILDGGVLDAWSLDVTPASPVILTGVVFLDLNEDGNRDSLDPGIGDVVVFADANGNGIRDSGELSVVTDAAGNYTLPDLEAGSYHIYAIPPENLRLTTSVQEIAVGVGRTTVAEPIGFSESRSIRGTVFVDQNSDGFFDIEEPGLSGVTVFLDRNANGRIDADEQYAITDSNGAYELTNLAPGVHRLSLAGDVQLVLPPDNQAFVSVSSASVTVTNFAVQSGPFVELEPNDTPETATHITPSSSISSGLAADDRDFFQFEVAETGRFRATVGLLNLNELIPHLRLLSANGDLILTSDGASVTNRIAELDLHLVPGLYRIEVSAPNSTTAHPSSIAYSLTTSFQPAEFPFEPLVPDVDILESQFRKTVAAGDFNGDGFDDLATGTTLGNKVSILLGLGDGSFRDAYAMDVDDGPRFLATADLNLDGILDLISANGGSDIRPSNNTVSVFLGVGDGTFSPEVRYLVGDRPLQVAVADFNRDAVPDLATVNVDSGDVTVMIGAGNGTFESIYSVSAGTNPEALTAADLNGDGNPDLAVVNDVREPSTNIGTISVLLGDGTGSFEATPQLSLRATVTSFAPSIRAGDINEDGVMDLIAIHHLSGGVILSGIGNGTFQEPVDFSIGDIVQSVVLEDLTGDGHLDIASANDSSYDVSVLAGLGDGTFGPEMRHSVEPEPAMLASGDFNGDGMTDLAVANVGSLENGSVSLIVNRGDGVFQSTSAAPNLTVNQVTATQIADVNGDGRPDIISASQEVYGMPGGITVFPGLGDGEFGAAERLGINAYAVAIGDVNRDGRLDVVSVNGTDYGIESGSGVSRVTVHLGLGDGRFELAGQFDVGRNAISVQLSDFDGDGILDAVTANEVPDDPNVDNGTVSVLIGNGDGTFRAATTLVAGLGPTAVIAEDFDKDGHVDLAVTNRGDAFGGPADNRVFIYWGNGDGTFDAPQIETVGRGPTEMIAVDLNRDGWLELVTVNEGARNDDVLQHDTLSIVSISSGRLFDSARTVITDNALADVVAGDFNGDALPDLIALGLFGDSPNYPHSVLLPGNGDLTFSEPVSFFVGTDSLQAADLNGDDVLDLVSTNFFRKEIAILLGIGGGSFLTGEQVADLADQPALLSVDVTGDGFPDIVTLDQDGQVFVRAARDVPGGLLASPFVFNADLPARTIASLAGESQYDVATVSRDGHTLAIYSLDEQGLPIIRERTELSGFVSVIATSDITGDGLDDVVGLLPLDRQIVVIENHRASGFGSPRVIDIAAATTPTGIDIYDINADQFPDIVSTSRGSGTLNVLVNDGAGGFVSAFIIRTSDGPLALSATEIDGLRSLSSPVAQQQGDFNGDGLLDILIVNQGDRSFSLLHGTGTGFTDPVRLQLTEDAAKQAAFGSSLLIRDFNQDGRVDQIISADNGGNVVNVFGYTGTLSVNSMQLLAARSGLAGLQLKDMDADGIDDLLGVTPTGDLIIFPGRSDGTFADFVQPQSAVPIAVRDLDGDGTLDVITANSSRNRVNIDFGGGADADVSLTEADAGFAAPGAVELADINRDGLDDLVVTNTGGNEVFLFPRLSAQSFATEPIVLFSGTNPSGVTIDDVNADGMNDLVVANRGSNDVTIFLGTTATATGFDDGRRLAVGAGPVSTDVMRDSVTGAITGLVVTNADAGTVSQLPATAGLSGSIFNDQTVSVLNIGQTSGQGGQLIGNSFFAANPVNDTFVFIPDLTNSFATGLGISTYDARGSEPSFLLTTDFNFDGFLDLIVANSGDGTVSLFAGDGIGFLFSDLLAAPSLAHPAAMDIAEVDGVLNLFVTDEGEDVATVFRIRRAPIANLSGLDALSSRLPNRGWWQQLTALFAGAQTRRSREFGDLPDQPGERTDAELTDALPGNFWQTLGDGIRTIYRQVRTAPSFDLLRGPEAVRGLTFGFRLLNTVFRDSVLRSIPVPWSLLSPVSAFSPDESDRAVQEEPNQENEAEDAPTEPQKATPDGAAERPAPGGGPGASINQQTVRHGRDVVPAGFARLASELPIRSQALLTPTATLVDSPVTDSLFAATIALFSIGGNTSPGSPEEIWHSTDDCEPTSQDQSSQPRRRRPWEEWPSRNAPLPRYWPWAS